MKEDRIRIVVEALKAFYTRYKKLPTMEWLLNYTQIEKQEINDILEILKTRGILKENTQKYDVVKKRKPDKFQVAIPKKKEKKTIKRSSRRNKINSFDKFIQNTIVMIFRIVSALVGVICTYVSIKFTFKFLKTTLEFKTALFLSIAIVAFLVISYNVRNFFRKRNKKVLVLIFTVLWFITLCYSMVSTLAVQAINLMEKEEILTINNSQDNNNILLFENLEKRIKRLQVELESVRAERNKLQQFLDKKEEMDQEYKELNYRLYLKNKRIDFIIGKIRKLEEEKEILLEQNIGVSLKKKINFYEWVSKVFGSKINPILIQFILSTLPAIFIDVAGPLSIYISLFLRPEGIKEM